LARRGHDVVLETWERWREHAEREGMRFAAAPEYHVFPTRERPLKPYEAAVKASAVSRELIRNFDPEVVVADILTVAAALAAELEGRPWATLVPHLLPSGEPGFPVYAVGAVYPRTRTGRRLWELTRPLLMRGEQQGRRELNGARARVGLPPLGYVHGGISRALALVATFPQLEYPREAPWPAMKITGPLLWEQPHGEVDLPPGDDPLVLVAPSTSQDPDGRLLRAALEGLAGEPVRVLATTNRRAPADPLPAPPNARVVDWVSYAKTMPQCQAVVCHAGHGTLARALACGVPLVACPHAGDMAENAARIRWAGLGVSLPRRFHTARGVRLAVRRLLADPDYAERARDLERWAAAHDGAATAADAVEGLAAAGSPESL
jgi:UDP:flavonoid glycosyltransferase YjiC (YdhE family)